MTDQISYDAFIALIERMTDRKESGSLYARTDTNHSVFVGLRDGNIVALVAGPKHGLEAVKTILKMSHCTCRRDDSPLSFHSKDLPATGDILALLKSRPPLSTAGESVAASSTAAGAIDSRQAVKILCEILHDYVGPVAPIICEDVTDSGAKIHSGADLEQAISSLAEEIDSGAEAAEFLNRARASLREYIP